MAGAYIEIEDGQVLAAINRLIDLGARPEPALKEIGEALLQSTERRFRSQAAPDGQPWAPLSPAYARRKARKGRGDLLLVYNGYLASTLRYQVSGDELMVGSDRQYAAVHQFGNPDQNIPARPFIGLSADDRTDILEILNEHLARTVSG